MYRQERVRLRERGWWLNRTVKGLGMQEGDEECEEKEKEEEGKKYIEGEGGGG